MQTRIGTFADQVELAQTQIKTVSYQATALAAGNANQIFQISFVTAQTEVETTPKIQRPVHETSTFSRDSHRESECPSTHFYCGLAKKLGCRFCV
jgi:hypothetical protein